MAEPIDPFLGVDHAWISTPTFQPHPHAGFSAVSYLFLDSETGIDNRDSLGNRNHIQPGGLHWTAAGAGSCMTRFLPKSARPCICCKFSSIWPLNGRTPNRLR